MLMRKCSSLDGHVGVALQKEVWNLAICRQCTVNILWWELAAKS